MRSKLFLTSLLSLLIGNVLLSQHLTLNESFTIPLKQQQLTFPELGQLSFTLDPQGSHILLTPKHMKGLDKKSYRFIDKDTTNKGQQDEFITIAYVFDTLSLGQIGVSGKSYAYLTNIPFFVSFYTQMGYDENQPAMWGTNSSLPNNIVQQATNTGITFTNIPMHNVWQSGLPNPVERSLSGLTEIRVIPAKDIPAIQEQSALTVSLLENSKISGVSIETKEPPAKATDPLPSGYTIRFLHSDMAAHAASLSSLLSLYFPGWDCTIQDYSGRFPPNNPFNQYIEIWIKP